MKLKYCVLIIVVAIGAFLFRLPRLSERPMHGDEAVHAIKFGDLLENGNYVYDSYEYHGPSLNYFTLIPAWLTSEHKLTDVTEITLRIVPLCCGVLLVLSILLISGGLGRGAALYAAILTAVSPAMVFFSRYYIQEMLLVLFTFLLIAFGYRYLRSGKVIWVILAGASAGLAHASKETCIIAYGAIFASLFLLFLKNKLCYIRSLHIKIKFLHVIAFLFSGMLVSALFFSSFGRNPQGIIDSVLTYSTYLDRASNNDIHIQPWDYYLKILLFYRFGNGPVWSEALIVALACIGFIAVITARGLAVSDISLLRFFALYTLLMTAAYSVISYKTPWCLLSFLQGMIILAGVGASVLIRLAPKILPRLIVVLMLLGLTGQLAYKAYLNNYKYYDDSRNPYVYAHPTSEIYIAVEKVNYYSQFDELGHSMTIDVICPGHDYWPLPWYFRSYPNVRYRDRVVRNEPSAPLIIASPSVEADLRDKFYDNSIPFEQRYMYLYLFDEPYYIWLRPKIELTGYIRKDLWDAAQPNIPPDEILDSQTND